jgi:hypothetical protein
MGICHEFPGGTSISHMDLMGALWRVSLILVLNRLLLNREYVLTDSGGYKYGNLALQVGGVSDETAKYGYWFCVTRTIE